MTNLQMVQLETHRRFCCAGRRARIIVNHTQGTPSNSTFGVESATRVQQDSVSLIGSWMQSCMFRSWKSASLHFYYIMGITLCRTKHKSRQAQAFFTDELVEHPPRKPRCKPNREFVAWVEGKCMYMQVAHKATVLSLFMTRRQESYWNAAKLH